MSRPLHPPDFLRDPVQEAIGRKIRRQAIPRFSPKGKATNSGKVRFRGVVERIPNPWRASQVDLVRCRCCKEYQLEGSKQLGYCRTCGTVN